MGLWKAVKKAAKKAAQAVEQAAEAVVESVRDVGEGIEEAIDGAVNELSGDNGNAWDFKGAAAAIAGGLDHAIIGSGQTLLYGVLDASETANEGMTEAIGEVFGDKWGQNYDAVAGRVLEGSRSAVVGTVETGLGLIRNGTEAAGTILTGAGDVLSGDGSGFRRMGLGFVKLLFQTPIDGILTAGGRWVSGAQTLVNAEPRGRKLTEDEIEELRRVFDQSVTYERILVKDGSAGVFGDQDSRPFVHLYMIYMKRQEKGEYLPVLVHEVTHVWQFENGGNDYMTEALWSQEHGEGYEWWKSVPGTPWEGLEPEQQAEMIEDGYRYGYFQVGHANRGTFVFQTNDYTEDFNKAVEQLRGRKGAP